MWLLMSGNDDLLRLGSQLKSIGGEKPTFAIVEKPVPLRLLDRFISGVRAARAGPDSGGRGAVALGDRNVGIERKKHMTTNPSRHLLVVDDEPEILAEVAAYLRRRGEAVVTASSFTQAMQVLDDDTVPIDILITDGRMPDGSGIDLLQAAIERPGGPHALILMTGHFEESDLSADLQEAGVVVVYKPFSLSALYREVGPQRPPSPSSDADRRAPCARA